MATSLKSLIHDKHISVTLILGDEDEHGSCQYIICGEKSTISVILDFNYVCDATEELASGIFARLEAYTVELEAPERSGLLDAHKMRSVESLSALSEPTEGTDTIPREDYSGRRNATFVNSKKIIIPVDVLIDSEASFEKASVKLTVNVYEERHDDSLKRFLEEPRMGAKMLRDLLEDETDSPLERANVTETLTTVCHKIPLFRPLQAAIEYVRMTDDSALISVQLTCNEALREEYTIDSLSLVLGDLASHAINMKDSMFEKRIFQVEPFSVPLPVSLRPGEVYGCIFQATRMPFAERLLRGKPQEMKVHLDASMAATWHERWTTKNAQNEKLLVSFESEVNLSRMFPNRHNGELAITLTQIFVNNGSDTERDLVIRKPLEVVSKDSNPLRAPEGPFISTEQMMDVYYSKYESLTLTFLPLAPQVHVGLVPPGKCATVYLKFLPIREGLHWIKRLQVTDQLTGHHFDLHQVLEVRVQTR